MAIDESLDNPYESPKSDLNLNATPEGRITLQRFSAWYVFFLLVVTLGFYQYYWLYTRASAVNKNTNNKFNVIYLHALVVATIFLIGLAFLDNIGQTVDILANLAYYVMAYTAIFMLRNRIQAIIHDRLPHSDIRLSIPLTFFFAIIYLQYKINEAVDLQNS